jgi:hypothetical protein
MDKSLKELFILDLLTDKITRTESAATSISVVFPPNKPIIKLIISIPLI